MTRTEADNLLGLLVVDELDEPTRAALLAYLETDAELRDKLRDLRLAYSLTQQQADASSRLRLSETHRRSLHLAATQPDRLRLLPFRPLGPATRRYLAAAAILILAVGLLGTMLPALGTARRTARQMAATWERVPDAGDAPADEIHSLEPYGFPQREREPHAPPAGLSFRAAETTPAKPSAPPPASEPVTGVAPAGETRTRSEGRWADGRDTGRKLGDDLGLSDLRPTVSVPDDGTAILGGQRASGPAITSKSGQARSVDGLLSATTPVVENKETESSGERRYAEVTMEAGTPVTTRVPMPQESADHFAIELPRDVTFSNAPEFDFNESLSNTVNGGVTHGQAGAGGGRGRFDSDSEGGASLFGVEKAAADSVGLAHRVPETSVAQPLPHVAMQRQAMAMQEAAQAQLAVSDPNVLVTEAKRKLADGDYYAAREALDQAKDYLREDDRRKLDKAEALARGGELQHLQQAQESLKQIDHAQLEVDMPAEEREAFFKEVAVAHKKLELAERAAPQMMEQAQSLQQAMQSAEELVSEESAPHEDPIVPGDKLALSILDAKNPANQNQQGWMATVDRRGRVQLPGSGYVDVAGKTPSQVQDEIVARLGRDADTWREAPAAAVVVLPPDAQPEQVIEPQPSAEDSAQAAPAPELIPVNPWTLASEDAQSTFAIDVDTASYGIARRHIEQGLLPPLHTVRMEEFVNAFDYQYPSGHDAARMFAVHATAGPAPFAPAGQNVVLLKIGVRGKVLGRDQLKPAHLVFVIDTSGSMDRDDRLPLVQRSLRLLLDQLDPADRVSVVTYGTHPSLLLEAAPGSDKGRITQVIDSLQCEGSTNLAGGVEVGFELAARHFTSGAVNRVILCSDGVANVGPDVAEDMLRRVDHFRGQGIGMTSIGFGAGTYNDRMLEQLANQGDGRYLYVGSERDARAVFVEDMAATLPTIARNVKIQVEFDPRAVRRYRLIGYENRDVADADFRNDAVKGGEVGSGKTATALYEVELADARADLGEVFIRYEDAQTGRIEEVHHPLAADVVQPRDPQRDPRFYLAACAAEFAEILRESEHAQGGELSAVAGVLQQVCNVLPLDQKAAELRTLVQKAHGLPRAPR